MPVMRQAFARRHWLINMRGMVQPQLHRDLKGRFDMLQAYIDTEQPVQGDALQGAPRLLMQLAAVQGHDATSVKQEVRKCAGLALKWSKQCVFTLLCH